MVGVGAPHQGACVGREGAPHAPSAFRVGAPPPDGRLSVSPARTGPCARWGSTVPSGAAVRCAHGARAPRPRSGARPARCGSRCGFAVSPVTLLLQVMARGCAMYLTKAGVTRSTDLAGRAPPRRLAPASSARALTASCARCWREQPDVRPCLSESKRQEWNRRVCLVLSMSPAP